MCVGIERLGDGIRCRCRGIDITPNGAFAYVAQESGNTVSVIDTATNTITATVPVGLAPHGVAITPNGTLAYAVNSLDNTVSVIDIATNTITLIRDCASD